MHNDRLIMLGNLLYYFGRILIVLVFVLFVLGYLAGLLEGWIIFGF